MCGLFAFTGPADPDPALLTAAATAAAARGPHGHGWSTTDTVLHALGTLNIDAIAALRGPRILGHARLATTGDYRDPTALQPIRVAGHQLAHNGTLRNYRDVLPDYGSDTVALAHVYAQLREQSHSPADALTTAMKMFDTPAWALLVLDADGTLLGWRHQLPLWRAEAPTGVYFASRTFGAGATQLPDDTLIQEPAR